MTSVKVQTVVRFIRTLCNFLRGFDVSDEPGTSIFCAQHKRHGGTIFSKTSVATCGLVHSVLTQRHVILMATALRYSMPLVIELVPGSVRCHKSLDPT